MTDWTTVDLFSAAAGGWSLGLHRAGFKTVYACEREEWRRTLYSENNPGVPIHDDVTTLTGERIVADLGYVPRFVAGSPPCQDISSANTKGKGVEGERSILFFDAIRIIGELREIGRQRGTGGARWFALENSANLRTRGADAVLSAVAGLGYACWPVVVRAGDGKGGAGIGANHERARSWIIGCDLEQIADAQGVGCDAWAGNRQGADAGRDRRVPGDEDGDGVSTYPDGIGRDEGRSRRRGGFDVPVQEDPRHATEDGRGSGLSGRCAGSTPEPEQPPCGDALDPTRLGHEGGRARRHGPDGDGETSASGGAGSPADADQAGQAGQADGSVVGRLRQAEISDDGRGSGWGADGQGVGQMGLRPSDRLAALQHRADWSLDDLASHIRLDDGLPAWLAQQRIAVGGPRGTVASSLIVEAFGDAVVPQIPEAIGRAILRVEQAYAAISGGRR